MLISLVIPVREDRTLGFQKRDRDPFLGMLEFPGGKIEPGENPRDTAIREWTEEVGLPMNDGNLHQFAVTNGQVGDTTVQFFSFLLIASKLEFPDLIWLPGEDSSLMDKCPPETYRLIKLFCMQGSKINSLFSPLGGL